MKNIPVFVKSFLISHQTYLEKQIRKKNIKTYKGVNITNENLIQIINDYDDVVLATGSKTYIPPIYNIDPKYVISLENLLNNKDPIGENILVVDLDWRQNPLGVVEWLIRQEKKVTIISSAYFVGEGIDEATLTSYYTRIYEKAKFFPLCDLFGNTVVNRGA